MSSAEINAIMVALSEMRAEIKELKNKRFTIEEIGIGSFIGWVKTMVAVAFFMATMGGSVYGILTQIEGVDDSLNELKTKYSAHMIYLHKPAPRANNATNS